MSETWMPDFHGGEIYGQTADVRLLHALALRARIVVAVALHEVDNAPDTKPGSQSYNKGLQNAYCRIKKCHNRQCGYGKRNF